MATLTPMRSPNSEYRHSYPARFPQKLWEEIRQRADREHVTIAYALERTLLEGLRYHREKRTPDAVP